MKITFLGGGNMASALIGGLLNRGFPAADISVIEMVAESRTRLEKDYRVRCYDMPDETSLNCDALILAVKPQQLRGACANCMPASIPRIWTAHRKRSCCATGRRSSAICCLAG